MVARVVNGRSATWTAVLGGGNLAARATDFATLTGELACLVYELGSRGARRLTCLHLETGQPVWEVEVPPGQGALPLTGLISTNESLVLTTWSNLQAFDVANGQRRYLVGSQH
jgi:outer membrane protein assembly factor BamB